MVKKDDTPRRRDSDVPPTLFVKLKRNLVSIAAIVIALSTLSLAPIEFDSRYAHADDLKELAATVRQQTDILRSSIISQQVYWLDYYNDRIRMLEVAKTVARSSEIPQLNRDIDDIKTRKFVLEKSLTESDTFSRFNR